MRSRLSSFLLGSMLALASAACGEHPPPAAPAPKPADTPGLAIAEDGPAPEIPRTPGTSSFAPSPLTPFANQVTDLIGRLVDGRPPGASPLPLTRWEDARQLVKSRTQVPTPRSGDLRFIVFAMELELVFDENAQVPVAPADGGEPNIVPGRLETIVFLSSAGLKIERLGVRDPGRAHPVPPALAGAQKFGIEIFEAARRGTIESLLVGEPERPVLDDPNLFEKMLKDRPDRQELERVRTLAASKRELIGLRFDDVFALARDTRGGIWGFKLEIEEDHGQLAFETDPLIDIERPEFEPR